MIYVICVNLIIYIFFFYAMSNQVFCFLYCVFFFFVYNEQLK